MALLRLRGDTVHDVWSVGAESLLSLILRVAALVLHRILW